MTQIKTFIQLLTFAATLSIANAAQAACGNSLNTAQQETRELVAKINEAYNRINGGMVRVGNTARINPYDGQYLKTDQNDSLLQAAKVVGLFTYAPFEGKIDGNATTFQMSACHAITARHVIADMLAINPSHNSWYVSLGQAKCDDNKQFSNENMKVTVAAMGKDNEKINDWAVLRTPKVITVPVLEISRFSISDDAPTLLLAHPSAEITSAPETAQFVRGQVMKYEGPNIDGTVQMRERETGKGSSGGLVLNIEKDSEGSTKLAVAGLQIKKGQILEMKKIIRAIQTENPELWQEIVAARSNPSNCR